MQTSWGGRGWRGGGGGSRRGGRKDDVEGCNALEDASSCVPTLLAH